MNQTVTAQHGLSKVKVALQKLPWFWIGTALVVLATLAPVGVFFYSKNTQTGGVAGYVTVQYSAIEPKKMVPGEEFPVLACQIIDGYWFNVLLEDKKWHQVKLTSVTSEDATPMVVELLKSASSPTVVLRRKLDTSWAVDFVVTTPEKRTTLLEWLKEKNLVLNGK